MTENKKKETPATRLRRNPEYYLKELEINAKRSREKGYHNKKGRIEQIELAKYIRTDKAGYPLRRRWEDWEIKYLRENQGGDYLKIAIYLKRSWNSITHKMERLKLCKYNKWN